MKSSNLKSKRTATDPVVQAPLEPTTAGKSKKRKLGKRRGGIIKQEAAGTAPLLEDNESTDMCGLSDMDNPNGKEGNELCGREDYNKAEASSTNRPLP